MPTPRVGHSGRVVATILLAAGLAAGCNSVTKSTRREVARAEPDPKIGPAQDANVRFAMGRAAEARGDLEEALTAYQSVLKYDPKRADALRRTAVVQDRLGRFAEAEVSYRKALAASPGDPEIFCDKGYGLYLQRKFSEAEACLKQAVALKPDLARAQVNLGLAQARMGKTDDALMSFRKGGCSLAEAHRNIAFVLSTERKFDDARKEYQLAMSLEPNSSPTRDRLAELDRVTVKAASSKVVVDPGVLRASGTR